MVQCSRKGSWGEAVPLFIYRETEPLKDGICLRLQGRFPAEPGLKVWREQSGSSLGDEEPWQVSSKDQMNV